MGYAEALALQQQLVVARRDGRTADQLLLLEHPPVVTMGRGTHSEHLLLDEPALARRGIELHECGRGGDVTYHGPGQLVGYPILALEGGERDAHRYLRNIEEGLIRAVAGLGVNAVRIEGLTGIWVDQEKLAAIGVRLSSGWVTSHGFAMNVEGPLDGFQTIVPCGIQERGITALDRLLDATPALQEVAARCAEALADVLGRSVALPECSSERLALGEAPTVSWEI